MNAHITSNAGHSDIIPGTNWTYGDAASMAKETARDNRLFGTGRHSRRSRPARPEVGLLVSNPARFEAETGWTAEDALAFALDERRERRLFGTH